MARRPHVLSRRFTAFTAALAALTLVATGVLVAIAVPASAAIRGFTSVFNQNANGDVMVRGNSMMTCPAGSLSAGSTTLTCADVQAGTANGTNNNFAMTYVDVDSDSSTFDSSSATVTIPAGATVLYAGLSWSGDTAAGSLTNYPALTGVVAPNASAKGTASFKAPGATAYSTVTSTRTDVNGTNYQAYSDQTAAVVAAGSGVYTMANVQAGTGGNLYAAWSLAIAYRDPTAPSRNLVIYTGYDSVSSSTAAVNIAVSGFTTPPSGTVVTRVGVVGYEGDRGLTGDGLTVGSKALSNSLNPANDIFNSSVTSLGVAVTDRTPSYPNLLGEDIDLFDATGAITAGSTTTTIKLTTSGETYFPGLVTFATDLNASAVTAVKTATDVNGGTLSVGDRLNYAIAISNSGGDASTATVLSDAVPGGATYIPGSLTVGGTAVTDAMGDDAGDINGAVITARLGTGATGTAGGRLAPGGSTTVAFGVTVGAATDGTTLTNTATFSNTNETTGTGYTGASNVVTSTVVVPPTVTVGTLPGGEVGAAYSRQLSQTGGTGPYVWTVVSGALPAGVTLDSSTGLVSGTPTTAGPTSFSIKITDTNGRSDTKVGTLNVIAGPALTFPAPPAGEVGAAYSTQPTVAGGTSPYTWSVSTGTLPPGVTLNASTGLLSGTPTTAGSYPITLQVSDNKGAVATKTGTFTIIAGPAITSSAPPSGEINTSYTTTFTATGGTGPYSWSVSSGTLPAGLTLSAVTGVVTGVPTASGTSNFTVTVTDNKAQTSSRVTSITVIAGPAITSALPPAGELGAAYSYPLTAAGGTVPYTWSVATGTLPAGLTLDPATGVLAGTPTAVGSSAVTFRVTDHNGQVANQAVTLIVAKTRTAVALTTSAASVRLGTGVTLTATLSPGAASGTVTFTDVPTTGPQAGTPVTLGSSPVAGGIATLPRTLATFGLHTVTATYSGDGTHVAATSAVGTVEVTGYAGEVIVTEFRTSGPNGANDSYVELYNTGPAVPLAGFAVRFDSGPVTVLPPGAGTLGTGRSYLITGSTFSLGAVATSDDAVTSLGSGGLQLQAPDSVGTVTDAVGPATGYHRGTGLPAMTGSPTADYAWWRTESAGAPVDSGSNGADFTLVSTTGGVVGTVQSALGSPSPTGTANPFQHNATLQSALLDPAAAASVPGNRVYVAGAPGTLTIRRTITNTSGATITSARVRITALSEANGQPLPGVGTQPATVALLRATDPLTATTPVVLSNLAVVTVRNLSVQSPSTALGGGLNSTFDVPLGAGLANGASISVAFSFKVDTHGTFWFGYDVDAM